MAKKRGDAVRHRVPPLFASYRRAYAFFSPASPERLRNGILEFRSVAAPLLVPTFARCGSVRAYGNAQRGSVLLPAFVPRGALGIE